VELRAAHFTQAKYIVVNADESEPGTCKDRVLIENDPHQLIEGMLIAALSVDAHAGYIYVRGEYRYLIEILDKAIAEAYRPRISGKKSARVEFFVRRLYAQWRGSIRVRRRIGTARIARREARHPPHPPALSGCGGCFPVPHDSE